MAARIPLTGLDRERGSDLDGEEAATGPSHFIGRLQFLYPASQGLPQTFHLMAPGSGSKLGGQEENPLCTQAPLLHCHLHAVGGLKGLNSLYLNFTLSQYNEIYIFGKKFLNFQLSLSGSLGIACAENANGTHEWIINNFFRFMAQFNYSDFTELNKNFSGFEVLDLLSPQQLSGLTVNSDALNNTDKISQILNTFTSRSFSDLVAYFTQFIHDTQSVGITAIQNTTVRDTILSIIIKLLEPQFPTFNTSDYIDWFQTRLHLLLPSITGNELNTIPTNITCKSYQAIVKGLDKLYPDLSTTQQEDIYNFIVKYLTRQLDSTASACTARTIGSTVWLLNNFGRFRSFITYRNLTALNKNFIGLDAVKFLTVSQLGELAGNNGTLRNADDVRKIFRDITSATVTEFINTFSTAVNQVGDYFNQF
ncbi:uncharacterized protein [Heptranchias perlo]|uniref:uncharacterized protein n=1 Tax=Heptranchias perlo TaxID=212740 RepID=UPI00355A3994